MKRRLLAVVCLLAAIPLAAEDRKRRVAVINFDPDDRRAASWELLERLAWRVCWPVEGFRAMRNHDLVRFRAALADDFVFDDHRRTGVGRIVGYFRHRGRLHMAQRRRLGSC